MIEKVASSFKKYIEPITGILNKFGIASLIFLVLMLVTSAIMRKAGYPMKGVTELSEFGMVLATFLFMSANYLKSDQMAMDNFIEKVPAKGRSIVGAFVHLVNLFILSAISWQLFAYGIMVQGMGQISVNLRIPVSPFIYIGAACSVVLTAVYIVHFLNALVKVAEAWRR